VSESRPRRILVVANETVGGSALIDAVRRHSEGGETSIRVICPQNRPRHGNVIYQDSVTAAAANRLELTLADLREAGVEARGEIVDPDPFTAIQDALQHESVDLVIISTHPQTRSGWLQRSLVDRVERDIGVEVEHVVVDLEKDVHEGFTTTLVVANRTAGGDSLLETLKGKAGDGRHRFILVCPQNDEGREAAERRLAQTLERMHEDGLEAIGQTMDPDPFVAVQNALQYYAVDEIVISTLEQTSSGWLRTDLVERVRSATPKPVEHVVAEAPVHQEASA
jgi:DNA-binding LacI/PurR family transcriptional regulator